MTPPFAPDVLALMRSGRDIFRYIQDTKKRKISRGAEGARLNEDLYSFLRDRYADMDVLRGPDGFFPAAIMELDPSGSADPEKLLGRRVPHKAPLFREERVVEALRSLGKDIWNDPTFSLADTHVDTQGRVHSMDAYIGQYYEQLNTGKYLEFELLKAVEDGSYRTPERSRVIDHFTSPRACLLSGGGIDAAISVSALVVYRRGHEYWMLCELRSQEVAEGAGLYHVPPSGIFQPVTAPTVQNLEVEFSLEHNLYREYLEELFGVTEVRNSAGALAPDYFYAHESLVYLQHLINAGSAQLLGTCLMFDLFSHRPEVCMLLIIEDPEWWLKQKDVFSARRNGLHHLALSSEFASAQSEPGAASLKRVATLPLTDTAWLEVARPWNMVPQGAPSLIMGAKLACKRLNTPEPMWLSGFEVDRGQHR